MILKSIEMQGFKSFPDKTVLELGKGITGVVGPNGSGKSNISDAVRWVLGEQSTKALRGARMEDVIFGGTGKRKALGYAEVTLRLDNTDKSLANDSNEVAVTRRYYRSGESEYKINGETVRLRDIHEIFMDTGLGRDGYSMVSQGKIADLVSAKSTQRRDMLEEAAGISHYRYRRADANRRLTQAEENLVRLRDILSELEGRIGPLKSQSEKAVKFLALSDEKKTLEIGLWLHTIDKSRDGLKEQENKLSVASSQYESVESALEKIENEIESSMEHGREITIEIENLTRQISESEENAAVIEGKAAVEAKTIEHSLETIDRIKADMGNDEKAAEEIDRQTAETQADTEAKEKKIEELRSELETEIGNLNTLLDKNGKNSEQVKKVNDKMTAAAMAVSALKVEESSLEASVQELRTRIEAIDGVLTERADVLTSLEKEKKASREAIDKLEDEKKENENALEGHRLIIEMRQGKADKLQSELEALNLDIYQKNARIRMLDDLERNLDGYSGSVQKVIKESKRGGLRGIHGTLSQLISTDAEYSTAVEIALGAAIQNIVTQDENCAKRAISFLKENRAGRATFLPLTTIKAKQFTEKGLDGCDGYIDLASNLVKCDGKYREIIESLLGRTAVVENIDDAVDMAKKYSYRFKIVTLDGQVMNAGGSMTGGSKGSGTGFLSRVTEIEELKEKVAKLQKEFDEKQKSYDAVAGEINAAQAQLDAGEAEIIKIDESLIRAESEYQLISNRYDTAKEHAEELKNEKGRAGERITASLARLEEIGAQLSKADKDNEGLVKELEGLDKEREELDSLKEKSAEIQNRLNIEMVSLTKEIEANREIIEAANLRKQALASKSSGMNEEIESINASIEETKKRIADYEQEALALRQSAKDAQATITSLIEKRTEAEGSNANLRAEEKEKNAEKEKLSGELARLEERKQTLETNLESTTNKLYEEYQLSYREAKEVGEIPEDIGKAQRTLQEIRGKIRGLGSVNVGAVEEYKEVSERYEYLSGQINDVELSKKELEKIIDELTQKMSERFREQFRRINIAFGETFKDLFGGGRAELSLDDNQDVLECNISIKVQPPGKNVQNIDLFSGGEKGLAAIALLFAILKVNPAPFCIFDEVEAALDDINVSRYAQYVRSMTDDTQFILITHRRGTMDEADVLYGVTMQEEGVSKMLKLNSTEMVRKLGLEN